MQIVERVLMDTFGDTLAQLVVILNLLLARGESFLNTLKIHQI